MCRTRRIKCDETKPTCNQCAKSRRQCPGYKDDFDLVFRNETQATERRARRAVNSKKMSAQITFANQQSAFASSPEDVDSKAVIFTNTDSGSLTRFAPPETISIPYEEQAPCFFLTNYVIQTREASRGYFDFIEPMLEKESPDSHLSLAFGAVAMASLANRPNSRGRALYPQALSAYTKALKAVNLALQNPALQKTDQTLAAILMLGFFETIASERSNAMAWYSHIDGAVQLVKMRGKKQLRTKVGNSLFVCVRAQMTTTCLSGSKAPLLGVDWWLGDQKPDDAGSFVTRLNLRIAELRYEINAALSTFPRTPEYFQEVINLMKRAQAMEQEYLEWEVKVPQQWRSQTVAWVDQIPGGDITKAEVCPGKVDMFPDLWTAHLWNSARVARLFISGVIVRCAAWVCSPVDYRTTPEYAQAVRLCGDLVTDMIASVPFFLGWRVGQGGNLKNGEFSGFESWGESGPPKAIGGFFVIWALFSISNTDFVSDSQRAWSKGRLMYISETLGLNHAKVLSKFQLRLPSMVIRRDALVHTPPTSQMMAPTMSRGYTPPAHTQHHTTTQTIHNIAAQHQAEAQAQAAQYQAQTPGPQTQYQNQNWYQNPSASPGSMSTRSLSNSSGASPIMNPPIVPIYTMNPLQQREAMQRETWEKERKNLLKKASNQQGDSVERLLANYLQV
ncbi:related to negative acting factor [Phialocephala subalpina]|uniref:Related to negative acting factor n=1 Tax=Phialocephala subalpina TaxID=576137 RepID=A0A1L7WXW5_9HELO|nr:related to negative acting factor [Phialocephala subalpina]